MAKNDATMTNGTDKPKRTRTVKAPTFMSRLAKIGEQFEQMSPTERSKMLATLGALYPTAPDAEDPPRKSETSAFA